MYVYACAEQVVGDCDGWQLPKRCVPRGLRTQIMDQRISSVVYVKLLNEPMKILLGVNFCYCFTESK